jgi:hypothetical protein
MQKLIDAYDRMMERVKDRLEESERDDQATSPNLQRSIEHAADTAVERGELTREEAHLLSGYIKRDLEDAGHHLATTGEDLRAWLRFDLDLIEDRLLEWLQAAADKTRLEMLAFEEEVERASHYHTGEITGPGSLQCDSCGEVLRFHATTTIPACPKCNATDFSRLARGGDG